MDEICWYLAGTADGVGTWWKEAAREVERSGDGGSRRTGRRGGGARRKPIPGDSVARKKKTPRICFLFFARGPEP